MNPNNWDRAKELFAAALELEPSERASFLTANCHEVSLQQQVEKLLIDYQAAGSFLDEPALQSMDETAEIEDPMINRRLGAYKLVRRLGRGGMAAVFLAVRADDEYQKEVAIKLVLPGFDSHDVLSRFRKERQTLAGLEHPNIVRLLDGGSTPEGWPFLVMDYVKGMPIDNYCDQHKLSVDDRLRLFSRVCEAVQYAHEKLVIHRDLKPSNILVLPDATPKLLDFGIAKVLNPEVSNQEWLATQTGRCMTPAYASPEQTRGKSVTAETDVYSLGVVLYELLTGHRPYRLTQHSPAEIERAICEQEPETPSTAINRVEDDTSSDGRPITKTPESVSLTREGQPDKLRRRLRGDLDNIVLKALQKEPQHRYSSVADFSQDIERHLQQEPVKARPSTFAYRVSKFAQRHKTEVIAACAVLIVVAAAVSFAFNIAWFRDRFAGDSLHPIQSLAVLPLQNLSGDLNQEYFSDGLTDGLITDLAQVGSLRVISRTSSMQYKQTKKTLQEIARELNVDGIVEGTVQRSGDRVRINVQLIHGPSDKHLWAKSYERDMVDMFVLERDVTADIAGRIQEQLGISYRDRAAAPQLVNPRVLEAYLKGSHYLSMNGRGFGDDAMRKAAPFFQQAIDTDPSFVPAYLGLADAHSGLALPTSEDAAIWKKAIETAVALAPDSGDARADIAMVKVSEWDWQGAEQEFRKAVALSPGNANIHDRFCEFLAEHGRLDEALQHCEMAQQLDPNHDHMAEILYFRRDYDYSIQSARMMLERDPDNGILHLDLYYDYSEKGMYKEAIQEWELAAKLFGLLEVAQRLQKAFDTSGYRGALLQLAKNEEELQERKIIYAPMKLVEVYAALGDKDRAFHWLEDTYKHQNIHSAAIEETIDDIAVNPAFDPLRSDPRFKDMLRRLRLPDAPINESEAENARNSLSDRLGIGSSDSKIQSLAVLPLQNLSGDPNQEYFSDGMTDGLIADLAQVGSLRVISRTSSMQYKQTKKSLPEIARELKVDAIVEGTVQRSGDRVRINVQLIHGSLDKPLWSKSYERNLTDMFALQHQIGEDIARQIHQRLAPSVQESPSPKPLDPKVLDAYLQGNYYLNSYSRGFGDQEKRKAAAFFQQVIDAEPDFAPAYVGLARAHDILAEIEPKDIAIARWAAEKAVELDPTSSTARTQVGQAKWQAWDWAGAEQEYRRAVALNPNDPDAHNGLADVFGVLGRSDEAWKETLIEQGLDPNHDHMADPLYQRGQFDRAIEIRQRIALQDPDDGYNHYALGLNYAQKEMYDQYVKEMEKAAALYGVPELAEGLRRAYDRSGKQGALKQMARNMELLEATKKAHVPGMLAQVYATLEDKDRAFYWLEIYQKNPALASTDPTIFFKTDPWFAPLRSDPRWGEFLHKAGIPDAPAPQGQEVRAAPQIRSIAVLPLQSLSGDPNQEYFSDGMTDALITGLAQIGSMKVASRTTSMRYKDSKKTLPEIARELNVDAILEGSVQRSGDRVRISAQLIYAPSDRHLWAKSYERDVRDVFALQRDVTQDIAHQVQAKLSTPNQTAGAQLRPINPKALDAYLQGNFHLNGYAKGAGDEEKRKAAEYFQQAINADPQFASAYNGLAKAHLGLLWPSGQDFQIATQAAERAIELDPSSSEALLTLGGIKEMAWDWAGAEEEYRRAIALNPKSADAHGYLGDLLDNTGRLDEGWKEQQIAFQLDPNNARLFASAISSGLELRGQYDRAIAINQMFLKLDPNDGYTHLCLARDYTRMGMYEEAMPHWERFWTLFGFPDVAAEVHRAFATSGYRGAMLESAKSIEHLMATHQGYGPVTTAGLYAVAGDKDQAFYWLEQAYSHRDFLAASTEQPLGYINEDQLLEPLRSDPRFKDLLRRMGLPELHVTESHDSGQLNDNN